MSHWRPTGERVVAATRGFNPTFQRHVAAYAFCSRFLPPGRALDLGCGVGHSFELLGERETVGVDVDAESLRGQLRETHVADMRALPFPDSSFAAAVCVQAIEHVPNPEAAVAEAARVLDPGGIAVFVTPNRLTFGRPDEIIDPYHHHEFDPTELQRLLVESFRVVEVHGIFGSARYMAIYEAERTELDRLLRLDPLNLRRRLPRRLRQRLYDGRLSRSRSTCDLAAMEIEPADFSLGQDRLEEALDLVGVCARPLD